MLLWLHWMARDALNSSYYLKGDYDQSIRILTGAPELVKDSSNPILKASLAMSYVAKGDKEKAMRWLNELISLPEENSWRSVMIASVYAALGDFDEFFVFANRAFNEKTLSFIDLRLIDRWIPGARKIREDPRFSELFSKAGLKLEADI